jgi:hypothetical protein
MTRSIDPCGRRWRQTAAHALRAAFAVSALLIAALVGPAALAAGGLGAYHEASFLSGGPGTEHRSWVRYYIVPPPGNGQKAFLFQIAAETLGNGDLYKEIFTLNKGRLQADGARLENPAAIDPGWILILPANAHGPGVHFGPLPTPPAAGQPGAGGAARQLMYRVAAGCLALLGMLMTAAAVRALRKAAKRRGRHRCHAARSHAAERSRRGGSGDEGREADLNNGQSSDRGPVRSAGLSPGEGTGAASPPEPPVTPAPATFPGPGRAAQAIGLGVPPARVSAEASNPGNARPDSTGRAAFSPNALRLLGVRAPSAARAGAVQPAIQRYEVVLGDYGVQAVLAEAPASNREGRSPEGQTWVASTPYLVWTPRPRDVPSGGLAFACVGAGDGGCLFIDLAAAPGPVMLGGEPEVASRLAESIAHQLRSGPTADRIHLAVVGDAVPAPLPPGTERVASAADLGWGGRPGPSEQAELVFCRLNSDDDVFPLARYVASARHRVVPIVLADLPGAPWSFTAYPIRSPAPVLQPVVT